MATAVQPAITPQFAALFRDLNVGRMEREIASTRRVIEAVPEDKKDYRPHPNSRSAWQLACHIANSTAWFVNAVADRNFAWTGEEKDPAPTIAGVGDWFDKQIRAAIARVRAMTPEELVTEVEFFAIMKQPVVLYLPLAQDHTVHHRGQLSAYLRPMGAKVPDIYGGSYDEPFPG